MDQLENKHAALRKIIEGYGSLLVAFSGGVDSSLLLRVASDVLGKNLLAVTAHSATYPSRELEQAKEMARSLGVRHRVVESEELSDERFAGNPPERCYWCKRELLGKLMEMAESEGLSRVAVASQIDDLRDYRPGERAVREMGVASPLREAGFTKDDIRLLSRRLGVPGWRREAMACLASRFPYGERISREKLFMVERAEEYLRSRGFRAVRVRYLGDTARIEVDGAQLGRFFRRGLREEVVRELKKVGFLYVSVDLEGYRTGSLNAPLKYK